MRLKIISSLFLGILLLGVASAIYCCERTTENAWCQNVESDLECNTGINPITGEQYKIVASFCESTSFCKPGTCIDNAEGTCIPSSQIVCDANYGFWNAKPKDEIDQCRLGCCLIGDQSSFVTQVSCNKMSDDFGVEINYHPEVTDQLSCIAMANPRVKGACVYTKEYVKTCELTTKSECQAKRKKNADAEFHQGFLCSAPDLETVCGPTHQTRCEGDDVYFIDGCGNLANIYDADKTFELNPSYWTYIAGSLSGVEVDCGDGSGNRDSATCGDCDFLSGTMCREKKVGDNVAYGNYFCKNLDCADYRGPYSGGVNGLATASRYPKHGETWCALDIKSSSDGTYQYVPLSINNDDREENNNVPGSSYVRLMCYNGEVTAESCDPTRQKICAEKSTSVTIEGKVQDFYTGNCKVNLWQSCTSQNNSEDCEDINVRDCKWITEDAGRDQGISVFSGMINIKDFTEKSYYFSNTGLNYGKNKGLCVPRYPPGFSRDGSNNVLGGESCGQASAICYVQIEKHIGSNNWICNTDTSDLMGNPIDNNCSCLTLETGGRGSNEYVVPKERTANVNWVSGINRICSSLGDCGNKDNFLGISGKDSNPVSIEEVETEE